MKIDGPRTQNGFIHRWMEAFLYLVTVVNVPSKEMTVPGPITLYDAQVRLLREIDEALARGQHFITVLKSRQLGISTILLLLDIFWLYMHPGMQGAVIADEDKNTQTFRDTITMMLDTMPNGFRIQAARHNKNALVLTNGSRLQYITAGKRQNPDLGRSRGLTFVHGSEVSGWGDQAGIMSLVDSLAIENPNRLYIFESTAKGYNAFYDLVQGAKKDPTKRSIFIGWWAKSLNRIPTRLIINGEDRGPHPIFEQTWGINPTLTEQEEGMALLLEHDYGVVLSAEQWAWWRYQLTSRSELNLLQEHPWHENVAFQVTGSAFFSAKKIGQDLAAVKAGVSYDGYRYQVGDTFLSLRCEPARSPEESDLKIYEKPVKKGRYAIGVDVAYGRNPKNDRHVIEVFRCYADKIVQVAEWATSMPETRVVAWALAHLAGTYRDCLSEDSEILTSTGWKTYDQVAVGDQVVGFDTSTGEYRWEAVERVIVRPHRGVMHRIQSDGLDCLVTNNHRVVFKKSPHGWRVKTAAEIAASGSTVLQVPIGGSPFGPGVPGLSTDMCRALGWIITDGCRRKYDIAVTQAVATRKGNQNLVDAMSEVFSRLCEPGAYGCYRTKATAQRGEAVSFNFRREAKKEFERWLCAEDIHRIPRELIEGVSEEQAKALFQGLLEGDGGWDSRIQAYSTFCPGHSRDLADGFQELALKLGFSTTITERRTNNGLGAPGNPQIIVRLARRRAHSFRTASVTREEYSGNVWCVSVPSGAFVMRRNGKVCVTGNCMINLDVAGPGGEVMNAIKSLRQEIEYAHLRHMEPVFDHRLALDQARWYLYNRPDTPTGGYLYGWLTNSSNKSEMMNGFRDTYASDNMVIRSADLLDEMTTIIQDGVSIAARGGRKDDRVFSAGLACQAWRAWIRGPMMAEGRTFDVEQRREENLVAMGTKVIDHIVPNYFRQMSKARQDDELRRLLGG